MSNVTYLPWVTPDPDADNGALHESVNDSVHVDDSMHVDEPTPIPAEVQFMAAVSVEQAVACDIERDAAVDSLLLDAELERLDSIVIRKLTAGDMSSGEVRVFLVQQGIPELDALRWVERYERLGYVDDERLAEALARAWSERKGKGRGAIASEMRRRHIDPDICNRVLANMSDESEADKALEVALTRARQLGRLDRATAERRLVGFLSRRGFNGSTVRDAVREALDSTRNAG
jgi:regulatory protein